MALEVAERLNNSGLPTELTVVGCDPFNGRTQPEFVRCEGFLDKLVEQDRRRIMSLLAESHFLIVPSLAECFGIVYCEANALGVPCLARSVGGVPTVIKDGVNGYLFNPEAPPEECARVVERLFGDYDRYIALARSSLKEYQGRLNWDVAGRRVREILSKVHREI